MNLVPALPLLPHETVFAIDPGNFETAYFILRGDGTFGGFSKVPNHVFLEQLRNLKTMDGSYPGPNYVFACEMVGSYGMAVGASVFETCVMIGRIQEIVGPSLRLIPRSSVKSTIKGRNDSEIRTRLIEQFGPPGTKKKPGKTYGVVADMWAALALAETVRRGGYKPYVFSYDKKKLT
jgi:hypothetical protein